MKWLRRKTADKKEAPRDLLGPSREVETSVEDLANRIFRDFGSELLDTPVQELPPAVWGAKKDGPLNQIQKQVHNLARPVIDRIINLVAGESLDDSRKFAVGYMARGLVISKLALMIEIGRRQRDEWANEVDNPVGDSTMIH